MPVKGRAVLGLASGLLLLLPLVLVLRLPGRGPRGPESPVASEVSPVLSLDERRQLLTYGRRCERPEDCEPPLGCLSPMTGGERSCLDSRCMTDLQCPEGFICQTLEPLGGTPLLRRCVIRGSALEGAPCIESSSMREDVCAPGLVCNGYCGRPCRPDQPANCPEGFFCGEGQNGFSCLPTCEGRACPDGRQCIRFRSGFSVCAEVRGENCQEQPCPDGQRCIRSTSSANRKAVYMECVVPCDDHAACPEGFVCDASVCRRPCRPEEPAMCGPLLKCTEFPVEKRWLCGLPMK
jgi:hypothetical protein